MNNAAFPQALADIQEQVASAKPSDFFEQGPNWYAPKFDKFVLTETCNKFLVRLKDNLKPEQFVEELERKAQEQYRKYGGTAQ